MEDNNDNKLAYTRVYNIKNKRKVIKYKSLILSISLILIVGALAFIFVFGISRIGF